MQRLKQLYKYSEGYRTAFFLLPLAVLAQVAMQTWIPYLMGDMLDNGIYASDTAFIRSQGILMLIAAVIMMAAGLLVSYLVAVWSSGVTTNLRNALFIRVQELSFSDADSYGTASILTRMSTDMLYLKKALGMINSLISCPITIIVTAFVTFRAYRSVSGVFIGSACGLILVNFFVVKYALRHYRRMFTYYDSMNEMLAENITAQKTVKAYARADYEDSRFGRIIESLRRETRIAETLTVMNEPLLNLVINGSILAIILISGKQIVAGTLQTGDFFCLISYAEQILLEISVVALIMVPILNAQVSMNRICEIIEVSPSVSDAAEPAGAPADGSVVYSDVAMSYYEGKHVLEDINLEIKPGEFVGIIGSSGSGKTSLINLIPRFYDCAEGSVSVGGRDVRSYALSDLRGAIGLVPQTSLLFSGTIADNLRWGNEDASAEEIVSACVAAGANDFVMGFPDGYETVISQGGTTVSGGQRQRLCIARALVRKPQILILDDSLSAVDNATERLILGSLNQLKGKTTVIMVSQRFTSVRDADRIIVLNDGRIDAAGTHDELLESSKVYREIYETQRRTMA